MLETFPSTNDEIRGVHFKKITLIVFRETVWGVMTGHSTDNITGLVMHEVKEIETWILRLLSAPVPVPGKTRVEVII